MKDPSRHRSDASTTPRAASATASPCALCGSCDSSPMRFFAKRYGHRAVVLETIAAVPGMVGGLLQHLKALRRIRDDQGWIRELAGRGRE